MYSRRSCLLEERDMIDDVVLKIAALLKEPQSDIPVSHQVDPKFKSRRRQIIARVTNYDLVHRLLKASNDNRKITGMTKSLIIKP